jgi:hypothetical protein
MSWLGWGGGGADVGGCRVDAGLASSDVGGVDIGLASVHGPDWSSSGGVGVSAAANVDGGEGEGAGGVGVGGAVTRSTSSESEAFLGTRREIVPLCHTKPPQLFAS